MLGQIIIGSVRNTPQFAPAEGEQELNIGGSLTVEAQFLRRVITKSHLVFLDAKRQQPVQYWNHSISVPGSQKNSSSICSNSLVRKVKLPGVISLRKDLPICPIPKGIFLREVLCTFLKLTKIPCAVSGLK